MAEPSPTRADLERLRRQKRLKELEEKRIRARSAANGQTPQFDIPVDPSKQSGALNTDPLDRVVDSFQNYNPQSGAGIKGPLDAFLFKGVNALTGGALQRAGNEAFEGTVQEGFGDQAVKASDTFPVGAVSGQIAGSAAQLVPAQRAVSVGRNLPVIKPIVDAVGKTRAGSYLGRLASGSAAWAGESALQGATTVAEEQSAYTGEKPTLESRGDLAKQIATMNLGDVGVDLPLLKDAPINVLGPVASSVARRVGTGIATQGASVTPEHVRKSVQASTGRLSGGPEQMRSVAEVIDAELAGGLRPQAIAAVQRLLKGSGLTSDDIMTLNRTVSERANAATGAAVGRKSIGQLYDEVLNDPSGPIYRPQASLNILGVLRERRMNMDRGDGSAGIIGGESRALRDSQKQILEQSARDNLGQGSRVGLSDQVAEAKSALSSEYNRVLAAAPSTGPGADTLKQILLPDPNKSSVLSRRAKNAGFVKVGQNGRQTPDVDAYINARPYEAAHWMRSKLSQASRSAQGAERMVLGNTVEQLDDVLDQLDTYAATKRQWGTEESLLGAQKFGDRLFGGANSSLMNNPGMRDELIRSFDALPDSQKPIALVSIRDAALGRMQGGPAGQSARLTALTSDAAIDFFNRVGARGFADDLTTIKNEQSYLNTFDPDTQSRTGPNQQAVANAPSLYGSTASNAVRADGQGMGVIPIELAASQVAPGLSGWYAGYRGLKAVANKAFDLRNATKEDMTRFLMARPNRQELPMRGQSPAPGGVPNAPPSPRGPSGGSTPPNAGTPGPEFPHVVRHDDGQEWGFKTRAEAEEFAARPSPPSAPAGALPMKSDEPVKNGLPIVIDRHGGVMGAAAGFSAAPDVNGDGRVSLPERLSATTLGGIVGRGAKKGAQRLNKTRPAGMQQYEQARLQVVMSRPDLKPGTPEYQAAVVQQMKDSGYGGPQNKHLKAALGEMDEAPKTPAPPATSEEAFDSVVTDNKYLLAHTRTPEEKIEGLSAIVNAPIPGLSHEQRYEMLRRSFDNYIADVGEKSWYGGKNNTIFNPIMSKQEIADSLLSKPGARIEHLLDDFSWVLSGKDPAKLSPNHQSQLDALVADFGESILKPPNPIAAGSAPKYKANLDAVGDILGDDPVSNGLPMLANPTAQGGVIGAGAGAMAPADSNEERLRNMAIGGALGAGAGKIDAGRRALPMMQNGPGGGLQRGQTSAAIRDGLREAGGRSRAPVSIETGRPIEPLPDNLRQVVDASTPIPGVKPSSRADVSPSQARGQLRDDLLRQGDDPQQVDQLIELLGDDAVNVLRDSQLGPAVSRGYQSGTSEGGGLALLVGALGLAGAYTAIKMAMRDSGNTKATAEDVNRAIEKTAPVQNLPTAPSRKPLGLPMKRAS
jgi:hypothetical protein